MRSYGSLLVLIGPYASLWFLMSFCRSIYIIKVPFRSLYGLMSPNGYYASFCYFMGFNGSL